MPRPTITLFGAARCARGEKIQVWLARPNQNRKTAALGVAASTAYCERPGGAQRVKRSLKTPLRRNAPNKNLQTKRPARIMADSH